MLFFRVAALRCPGETPERKKGRLPWSGTALRFCRVIAWQNTKGKGGGGVEGWGGVEVWG